MQPPPLPSVCVGAPPPHAGVGPVMTVRVLASSAASQASVDSSTRARSHGQYPGEARRSAAVPDLIPKDGLGLRDRERHAVVGHETRVDDLRRRRRVEARTARDGVRGSSDKATGQASAHANRARKRKRSISTSRPGAPSRTLKPATRMSRYRRPRAHVSTFISWGGRDRQQPPCRSSAGHLQTRFTHCVKPQGPNSAGWKIAQSKTSKQPRFAQLIASAGAAGVAGGGAGKRDVGLGAGAAGVPGLASSGVAAGSASSPTLASSPEDWVGAVEPPPPLDSTIAPPPLPLGSADAPPLLPPPELPPPPPEVEVEADTFDEVPDPSLPAAQPTRQMHPRRIAREDGRRADLFISGSPCPCALPPPAPTEVLSRM